MVQFKKENRALVAGAKLPVCRHSMFTEVVELHDLDFPAFVAMAPYLSGP